MNLRTSQLLLLLISVFTIACSDGNVGSSKRPFTMYFIPSVDSQQISATASVATKYIERYVSQKLYQSDKGFYVKSAIPTSYIAVVEAFGTKKADFADMTTFSYILAKDVKKYPVEAVLTIVRQDGTKTYKGQIIARADGNVKKLEDLNGKKFAYTDPASTSGFILPAKLFRTKGIQLGETVFAQKHDNVVTMVYNKQVDAGATYYSDPITKVVDGKNVVEIQDARVRVKTQFPDVEQKVKILGFTEEIPNEPWVIRTNLYSDPAKNEQIKGLIVEALRSFAQTQEGRSMLSVLATAKDLVPASDADYASVRKSILEANIDLEKILTKKK